MAAAVNASLFDMLRAAEENPPAPQPAEAQQRRPSRKKQEDVCPPLPPEYSFKPRIIHYEKVTQRPRPPRAEMLARLAAPRSDYHSERARLRAEREREEMAACTFQPQLCEGTKRRAARAASAASMTSAPPLPLPDRLQQRQLEVERRRRRRQLELQEAEMAPCSFTPHISPAAATLVRQSPPLHERLGHVQRERRERLASLKARLEAEADGGNDRCCPSISALSEQLARGADCSLDGAEGGEDGEMADAWGERRMQEQGAGARGQQSRMQREAQRREQQRMQRLWEYEQQQAAACPFAPRLSVGTLRLVSDDPRFVRLGFLERQALLDAEAARRRQDEEVRQEEERGRWFRPEITALAKQHQQIEKGQGQEGETPMDRARRLSVEEAARREEARARRTEEYYAGVATFRPALNPVSQALGLAAASVDELVYDCRREQARSRAAAEAEARLREACTFQPALASSAVRARSSGCPRARRRQAQELARQAQAEREREEAEACTFRPDTRASRRSFEKVGGGANAGMAAHPIVVPGLGSFLARHKLAERQQRERERALTLWARR